VNIIDIGLKYIGHQQQLSSPKYKIKIQVTANQLSKLLMGLFSIACSSIYSRLLTLKNNG
jgi:hypothetical protein